MHLLKALEGKSSGVLLDGLDRITCELIAEEQFIMTILSWSSESALVEDFSPK